MCSEDCALSRYSEWLKPLIDAAQVFYRFLLGDMEEALKETQLD